MHVSQRVARPEKKPQATGFCRGACLPSVRIVQGSKHLHSQKRVVTLSTRHRFLGALLLLGMHIHANAQAPTASTPKAPEKPKTKSGWQLFGSWRVRPEIWNWFPTSKADGSYSYVGSVLKLGAERRTSHEDILLELEQPSLFNLPTKAIASAPQGQLGLGANYYAANGGQVASLFLKQGYVRLKNIGHSPNSLRLGRFEFSDGAELPSSDASLAYLKRERISQRLVGPFAFTHVGRSFDGLHFSADTPGHNVTAMAAFPTRGVFSLRGMDTLTDVRLAYLSASNGHADKKGASEARLFGIYYDDLREGAVKTDNRPAGVRAADHQGIHIATIGGHLARVANLGADKADGLLWAAGQFGDWGTQRHGAFAFAAEAGYQANRLAMKPWFRLGFYYASGDSNAKDNLHGTFFPILPTPRLYARMPFYSETNLQDAFAQVILRPNPRLTVRADAHQLALADGQDLWYAGGGAFENSTFGYAGRSGGGSRSLASLFDISADYQIQNNMTLTLYFGYANGGNVVKSIYSGSDATFGYLEANLRF